MDNTYGQTTRGSRKRARVITDCASDTKRYPFMFYFFPDAVCQRVVIINIVLKSLYPAPIACARDSSTPSLPAAHGDAAVAPTASPLDDYF